MQFFYFDETKYSPESPYFFIGGIAIPQEKLASFESRMIDIQTEFHGSHELIVEHELHGVMVYQGKGPYKGKSLPDRLALFEKVAENIKEHAIPIRIVCIDVPAHKDRYNYPEPEYRLGLMLILERFSEYLDSKQENGFVFGDYEKDEITNSIQDFASYRKDGSTPMYHGRSLQRLKDTIYFTQSHHSRLLQAADLILYMANRYENGHTPDKWHDKHLKSIWDDLKAKTDYRIKRWP